MSAAFPTTAQASANAVFLGNLRMATPWFSQIIGLVQRTAAVRAPLLPVGCREIEIYPIKKLKKADSLKKLW